MKKFIIRHKTIKKAPVEYETIEKEIPLPYYFISGSSYCKTTDGDFCTEIFISNIDNMVLLNKVKLQDKLFKNNVKEISEDEYNIMYNKAKKFLTEFDKR